MTPDDDCSCEDYTTSRRSLLRNMALTSAGAMATTVFGDTLRQTAYGATNGNVVVVLSLRGGCDTLSLVVPHADPGYAAARPHVAIPTDSLICADTAFGLHPAFAPLQPMWNAQKFGVVLATGLPGPNRSHFEAIEEIEDADLGSDKRTGWINRLVGLDELASPLEAVALGSGMLPVSMYGAEPTLSTASTDDIGLAGPTDPDVQRLRRQALEQVWQQDTSTLGLGARSSLDTSAKLAPMLSQAYAPANGAQYPVSSLGEAMQDTARMIKAGVGVEVVTLDHGTWDMHTNIGPVGSTGPASMHGMVSNLAQSLAAFFADLGPTGDRVTLVTLTEFGRRVSENGARGFDHGWANSTLMLGGGVKGGQYHGTWPGLGTAKLVDGDLKVTTDYRSVLTEILSTRLQASSATVFPDFHPEAVNAIA